MKPQRIQLSRKKGWRMPENTVKVDRTTKWGNPFTVHGDGYLADAKTAVWLFEKQIRENGAWSSIPPSKWPNGKIPAQFTTLDDVKNELRGKNLACWCALDQPCHADVLLTLANEGKE